MPKMLTAQTRPKIQRGWQATIGLDEQCFMQVTQECEEAYKILYDGSFTEVLLANPQGKIAKFKSISDLIFYTLCMLKSGITFDYAAFLYQFDQANAHRNFVNGINLLHYVLDQNGFLPLRSFDGPEQFECQFSRSDTLLIDATEQRIQRPQDQEGQRDAYSGKKKSHTVKSMIISTLDRYIWYVSVAYVGRTHDYSLLKSEFDPALPWFDGYKVRVDLGYQGFFTDYPGAVLFIPKKKPKGGELTETEKLKNRELARERIFVEHSIGGMKRYDILSTVCRIHDFDLYDKILASCAGLWNFFITR